MSHAASAREHKTPVAPARAPDGWPMRYSHYRNYLLFAATSIFMALGCIVILEGLYALSQGEQAWAEWLAMMAQPHWLFASVVVLGFSVYFAIRFGWVGRKIGAGRIGPVPPPPLPLPVLGILPIGGFVTLWLVLLIIMGGVLS